MLGNSAAKRFELFSKPAALGAGFVSLGLDLPQHPPPDFPAPPARGEASRSPPPACRAGRGSPCCSAFRRSGLAGLGLVLREGAPKRRELFTELVALGASLVALGLDLAKIGPSELDVRLLPHGGPRAPAAARHPFGLLLPGLLVVFGQAVSKRCRAPVPFASALPATPDLAAQGSDLGVLVGDGRGCVTSARTTNRPHREAVGILKA